MLKFIIIFANFLRYMRFLTVLICIILSSIDATAQTYEIGGTIGGANFIGDVGRTNYLSPNSLMIGGIAKWNRSERHSFRLSVIRTTLSGDDADSGEARRQQRGFSFENDITEVSLGLEFTFWEFNTYGGRRASTPYLYTGVTYFGYEALSNEGGEIVTYDNDSDFAIPMVLGYKATVGTHTIAAFEIGARYAFTDGLDGSNPSRGARREDPSLKFGNINNNDWYVFTSFTFTFTFGRKPCYCNF